MPDFTPQFGWPIPEATDRVTDGWDAIADLGLAIEADVGRVYGYAQVTASQATITTVVDLTGLTVTTPVLPAGRRLRVKGHLSFACTVAGGLPRARIMEGATQLMERSCNPQTTNAIGLDVEAIILPAAGAHTYKLAALLATGTGSMSLVASATAPAWLLVEDMGPA